MELRRLIEDFRPGCAQEEADRRVMLAYPGGLEALLPRNNEVAHLSASAWIVDPAHTRVLMVWHNIYRHWSWTGGHADGEADLRAVALREAVEETGAARIRLASEDVFSLETLTVLPHIRRGRYVPAHLHMNLTWLLEADPEQPLRIKPDENSGVRWFPIEEVVAAANEPEMTPIYEKLLRRM